MAEEPLLLQAMRQGLAAGETHDSDLRAAGYRVTRDIRLRAYLELSAAGLPEGSRFVIRGGRLFRGGELVHQENPTKPVMVTAWGDIWLPPIPEVSDLWAEVAHLALEQPDHFRAAMLDIQKSDEAFDTCPP